MSSIYTALEKHARNFFPTALSPIAKKIIAYPRYYSQINKCRSQFEKYKDKYGQKTLYVAGLPKSGTTWLEKMLSTFPGFSDVMIPEAVAYEQDHRESHSFDFPADTFTRLKNALVVLKLHSHGSANNFEILQKNNINFVVIFRDLRDVAVSHIFYVKRTSYHPEHKIYKDLNIKESLIHFSRTLLPEFIKWVESWQVYADSPLSYIVRYEDLLEAPNRRLMEIANHYGMKTTQKEVDEIIERNSFKNLSGGRDKGAGDTNSFFRKGISGDWKNQFDEEVTTIYNTQLKDFLLKYGYE